MCCCLGANELAVQKAKTEITRLIKEELIRLVSIHHTAGCHADIKIKRSLSESLSLTRYVEQVCVQHTSMKDVAYCLFPSFFFFSKIRISRRAKAGTKCCRGGSKALWRRFHLSPVSCHLYCCIKVVEEYFSLYFLIIFPSIA